MSSKAESSNADWAVGATAIGIIVAAVVALTAWAVIVNAVILTLFWGWFIMPAFGISAPAWPLLVGISVLLGYVTGSGIQSDVNLDWSKGLWVFLGRPAMLLAIGYVLAQIAGTA